MRLSSIVIAASAVLFSTSAMAADYRPSPPPHRPAYRTYVRAPHYLPLPTIAPPRPLYYVQAPPYFVGAMVQDCCGVTHPVGRWHVTPHPGFDDF